ncbi:hypothetical protein CC80DRAFT_226617 [Byssothecium circinans]|uniref:C2H2-type domain-containing protein n=1 Tax=Byssothecium circinans TaxID=147558 RepID=A0A6A5TE78_9PLEO|nr:hypothetical protein CC80DRAFT_226617 [Byssothecium circinans]
MSDLSETGGRPLPSSTQQTQGNNNNTDHPPSTSQRRRRRASQSSDERISGTKSNSSRRRLGTRKEATLDPHVGSPRGHSVTMQRSTSPAHMSPESVHYTRTGRISKAKKGLKVHNCHCGRSYTRAEHLRRHQKNHAPDALRCEFPGCGKPFFRVDLLERHQERHNEVGNDSPQAAVYSPGSTSEPEAQVSVSAPLPTPLVTTVPQPAVYYPQSVSPMPESAADPSQVKHRASFSARQAAAAIPVGVDGLQTNITWNDPFNHSPNYSSSSGYASPIPGAGDYANMFANPPYGPGSNRTRTSSNASYVEPWSYPSRSPTSATSTMAYTWTSNDKSPAPSHMAYMATSYPMTSMPMQAGVDPMTGYGHFGPKTMAQRDQEEQEFLFPEQCYGMGQIAHTYPYEQYLDNFWRHFHPTFPIIHRVTFESVTQPPMLHAAMIAIGGQYSNDACVKRKSRILHDRCMKLLEKRDHDVMTEADRLYDWQALFLVEFFSQYRARRAAKKLSPRFESMYQKLFENFRIATSDMMNTLTSLVQPENATYERWSQWVDTSVQQRLLISCYILEHHQATLLARTPQQPLTQLTGFDLPIPSHSTLWDATTPSDWALESRQYAHLPTYVYQVTPDLTGISFDAFQSSLLIATHYNHFNNPAPYLAPQPFVAIDHLLYNSAITKHQLLTAKLLQVTPIRALLAVSGESWILSEKVPSPAAFTAYKATLRNWLLGLWTDPSDSHGQPVKDALKIAIQILQNAMAAPNHTLRLEHGSDMGLYYAALMIWSVTVAANSRVSNTQPTHQYQSQSPLTTSNPFPPSPNHLTAGVAGTSPNPTHPAALCLLPDQGNCPVPPSPTTNSMLRSEMTMTCVTFLNHAFMELNYLGVVPQWPREIAQWQQGCSALMQWVKMRLRNAPIEGRDSVVAPGLGAGLSSAATGRGGDGFGELLDGVIGVLGIIMGRGWEGWEI